MVFRISSVNRLLICSWTGVVFCTAACGATPVAAQVQPQPTCISSKSEVNPYSSQLRSDAVKIYENYKFGTISYDSARQAALSLLGENINHWSDQVDVASDDTQMVRIVATYMDPILVQYIVLNQVLAYSNNLDLTSFNTMLTNTMNKLGNRGETLFIITVTAPFYNTQAYNSNVLTVNFPVAQMVLVNASGMEVKPTHVDPVLKENIDITHGPVSGIIGFPQAVISQGQCAWVLDPWTSSLTIHLPSVTLGGKLFNPQFWDIPYRALLVQDDSQPTPTFDPNYDWSRVSKIAAPPTPSWNPNIQFDNTNWKMYWEDMGRYIWDLVVSEGLR